MNDEICPCCGSWDITGENIDICEGFAVQELYCADCDADWTNSYKLNEQFIHSGKTD